MRRRDSIAARHVAVAESRQRKSGPGGGPRGSGHLGGIARRRARCGAPRGISGRRQWRPKRHRVFVACRRGLRRCGDLLWTTARSGRERGPVCQWRLRWPGGPFRDDGLGRALGRALAHVGPGAIVSWRRAGTREARHLAVRELHRNRTVVRPPRPRVVCLDRSAGDPTKVGRIHARWPVRSAVLARSGGSSESCPVATVADPRGAEADMGGACRDRVSLALISPCRRGGACEGGIAPPPDTPSAGEKPHSHHVERWLSPFAELGQAKPGLRAGYEEWAPRESR